MNKYTVLAIFLLCLSALSSQPWEQDNSVFNPSGVPSLTFSQPRFADLDGDGDLDFFLGNTNRSPLYIQNTGTASSPAFAPGPDLAAGISSLAAEMGVCADLDADGDLDFITGGYTGLHLFLNTGSPTEPVFVQQPGFFSGLAVGSIPVPDLADVDGDGDLDLVVGLSEDGGLLLYTNIGTPTSAQFSQSAVLTIGDVGLYAYPVFCDLDGDGDQDILAGRDSHGFVYFENIGTPTAGSWQPNSAVFSGLGMQTYWNSPDLVDLNGDGLFDLVFGTASGPLQYYVNTGTATNPVWQANTSLFGGVIDVGGASSPVFYDFDGDGDLDLISGSQMGDIKYYENTGSIHAPAWSENSAYFSSIDHSIYAAVAIGDLNGDGLPDAVIGDLSGNLYFHRNTGFGFNEETGMLPNASFGGWSVPRLIDMDSDGDLDLVVGNEAGNLRYFENQGTPQLPDWNEVSGYFGAIDVGSDCSPTLGDIDGDGDLDLLAGNLFGNLQCYLRGAFGWTLDATLFAGISTDQNAAPALADLDHDGDLDLVLGDYDGTFSFWRNLMYSDAVLNPPQNLAVDISNSNVLLLWDPPAPGSTSPFEHYQVWLDGEFQGGTGMESWILNDLAGGQTYFVQVIAQYIAGESVPAAFEFSLAASDDPQQPALALCNYPNPFNPNTTISFSVEGPGLASLRIYSYRGQLVKAWDGFAFGIHNVAWDGRDEQGKPVSSGVYFYRLESGNRIQNRKMLLLK
ncbi:MAG: VCBS repeat-containing protein [Candidatus Syntrophosphaera sp.]|nr:VCBS repeat-containing protein [Candidatus Syntrophosphaera sp.]